MQAKVFSELGQYCSWWTEVSLAILDMPTICQPSAQGNSRNLEARVAQASVFHFRET
jgi:hypothetical protein